MLGKSGFALLAVASLLITTPAYAQTAEAVDSKARGGVVALADRVAALESLVGQLNTELSGAQSAIGSLEGKLATAQSRISLLETGLAAANGRITVLEPDLATANGRITEEENRIASLRGDVAGLQGSDAIQNDDIVDLRIDLSAIERIALRTEIRSSASVTSKLSLRDPGLIFRVDNSATVTAMDETLAALVEFRCRFSLSGCTDPSIEPVVDFLPVETLLVFETALAGWETDLAGLKSLAQSGTVQVNERDVLTVLDNIEQESATLAELTQGDIFQLQREQEVMAQAMQAFSNLLKAWHDSVNAIVNNLRT